MQFQDCEDLCTPVSLSSRKMLDYSWPVTIDTVSALCTRLVSILDRGIPDWRARMGEFLQMLTVRATQSGSVNPSAPHNVWPTIADKSG